MQYIVKRIKALRACFFDTFLCGKSFAFWGLLTLLLNFVMLHALGFSSDLEFWRHWISDLEMGVGNFKGDYPPFYILWLRVVAAFYGATDLSMDLDYELKLFCIFPVILAHISLAHFVWLRLQNRAWRPELKTIAMLLVVANPAFYLDGPVWGQVDVLPVTICVWALWFAFKPSTYAYGIGLFMLGLLTKFQMIMFLPVFAAISLRYRKIMWKGLFAAAAVFGLVFLPFILAGNFVQEFKQAYLSTLNSYPYAAMNAGNLWMAISGNMTPDSRTIFEWAPAWMNPGLLGKIFFVIVSATVMFLVFIRRHSVGKLMYFAALNALAFFMLLPCMHERYVLAAAVVCIAGVVCSRKPNFNWAVGVSALAFVNISMMMSIRGDSLWFWISVAGICLMVLFLFKMFFPRTFERLLARGCNLPLPAITVYALLFMIYAIDVGVTFAQMERSAYMLKDGEMFVYDLDLVSQMQGYGSTHIGKSIDNNPLHVKGELFVAGIGTHAPSQHVYKLPKNAKRFTVSCGIDDESGNGVVEFIIKLDGREVWRSGRMEGRQIASADIDVSGADKIYLVTDELGSKNFDHADWVNPVVHTEE